MKKHGPLEKCSQSIRDTPATVDDLPRRRPDRPKLSVSIEMGLWLATKGTRGGLWLSTEGRLSAAPRCGPHLLGAGPLVVGPV